jgi:hypothetical protein
LKRTIKDLLRTSWCIYSGKISQGLRLKQIQDQLLLNPD